MEHPIFIITNGGHLRLGMVTLHRDPLGDELNLTTEFKIVYY